MIEQQAEALAWEAMYYYYYQYGSWLDFQSELEHFIRWIETFGLQFAFEQI